jgi:hypothetical protein
MATATMVVDDKEGNGNGSRAMAKATRVAGKQQQ